MMYDPGSPLYNYILYCDIVIIIMIQETRIVCPNRQPLLAVICWFPARIVCPNRQPLFAVIWFPARIVCHNRQPLLAVIWFPLALIPIAFRRFSRETSSYFIMNNVSTSSHLGEFSRVPSSRMAIRSVRNLHLLPATYLYFLYIQEFSGLADGLLCMVSVCTLGGMLITRQKFDILREKSAT